jgi:hypothetical protein
VPLQIFSQGFFEGNSVWHMDYYIVTFGWSDGWKTISYKKDTVINGLEAKQLEETSYLYIFNGPYSSSSFHKRSLIYREENNIIYRYFQGDGFVETINFNLVLGDTVIYPLYQYDPSLCDSFLLFEVINVGNELIGGETLKYQVYKLLNNLDWFNDPIVKVYDKIGCIKGHPLDFAYNYSCYYDAGQIHIPKCYRNELLGFGYPSENSCTNLPTNTEFIYEKDILIDFSPNPFKNKLSIIDYNESIDRIEIYYANGQLVFKGVRREID